MKKIEVSLAEANEFLAGVPDSGHWPTLSIERKRGALDLAFAAVEALGYRLPEKPNYIVRAAICMEALARTDAQCIGARKAAASGVSAAAIGHASERYASGGGPDGLWSRTAASLLRPYALRSAEIGGPRR